MIFQRKLYFRTSILMIIALSSLLSFSPVFAQQLVQYPTLSVNPSNVVMYTPSTTINVDVSHVTGLNLIHLIFSFNNQGSTILSVSPSDVTIGNLFTGTSASLYTNIYSLNTTGFSYINALVEMPLNVGVNSTVTMTVLSITLHLLPTAIAGLQSGLNLQEADAYFTSGQYIDNSTGLMVQNSFLTVGYLTTTMAVTSTQATVGTAVTLTSTLQDSAGNPLSGMSVNYYVNSQSIGTATTDASGVSTINYTPTAAGTYAIKASYTGNQTGGIYASSNATGTLTVNSASVQSTLKPTALTLSVPQTVATGVPITVSATLTQGGSPLPNENIIFSQTPPGGSAVSMGYATTDSSGVATLNYTFITTGSHTVEAQFLGDANDQPSNATVNVVVSQTPITSTTLTLSLPSTASVNQEVIIYSTLKSSNQQPISDATVEYTAIGKNGAKQTIGSAITNSDGNSSIIFVPTQVVIYQINANFGGSALYSSSADSGYLTIAGAHNVTSSPIPWTLIGVASAVAILVVAAVAVTMLRRNGSKPRPRSKRK
ncbi:MAG TPA: Ig-like domain repeat protein [Candidatus Limnocylindrales bacterium]|nr:Ig-like domain repeat protein [Candidatus Limnocylindrales bacterium]